MKPQQALPDRDHPERFDFKLCTDEFEVRVLDYVIVKGKTEAVTIYELLADKGDISTKDFEFVGLYEEGIAAYRKREWDQAIRKFSKALECKPSDTPAGLFLKRCEEYRGQTLPDDWSESIYSMKNEPARRRCSGPPPN